jgi:hypothetical protein
MGLQNFRRKHGGNNQYLLSDYKKPPVERVQEIEEYRLDKDTFRVYPDSSELHKQGIFGLAFTCVGGGSVIVKSRKYYNQNFRGRNVYAEVVAIAFAMNSVRIILKNFEALPEQVNILSDLNWIGNLENSKWTKHPMKKQIVEKVQIAKKNFQSEYPLVNLNLSYTGAKEKKYNPFYKAAHNASRDVLGKI